MTQQNLGAFHGDPALKLQTIEAIGKGYSGPKNAGSALTESGISPQIWEFYEALCIWDRTLRFQQDHNSASLDTYKAEDLLQILSVIAPGADLSSVVPQFLIQLLASVISTTKHGTHARSALRSVREMLYATVHGRPASAQDWQIFGTTLGALPINETYLTATRSAATIATGVSIAQYMQSHSQPDPNHSTAYDQDYFGAEPGCILFELEQVLDLMMMTSCERASAGQALKNQFRDLVRSASPVEALVEALVVAES